MSTNTNRNRGKRLEKQVAKAWNAERIGITGGEDISHPIFSVECKERNSRSSLHKFIEQAERNCPDGKIPIVVYHILHQQHGQDLIILRRKDFEDLNGNIIWRKDNEV